MNVKQIGPNQTILTLNNGNRIGFSYETPVVAVIGGEAFCTEKKFSVTTSKHCGKLLSRMSYSGESATLKPQSFFEALV